MAWKTPILVLGILACACWISRTTAAAPQSAVTAKKHSGKTIEAWVEQLVSGDSAASQEAKAALIEIGQPAGAPLVALVDKRSPKTPDALAILGSTKEVAREVIPRLKEIAEQQKWPPETWMPFYRAIAENKDEEQRIRTLAVQEFKKMGKPAIPVLREMMLSGDDVIRNYARYMAVEVLKKEGTEARVRFFTELIERDMFAPDVGDYLSAITGYANSGRTHPMREKVKAAYRQRLRQKPDAKLAWDLAAIIQDQLLNTAIAWETHSDSVSGRSARECPSESFVTLAEVLELGFARAKADLEPVMKRALTVRSGYRGRYKEYAETFNQFGIALAKLRLLQGDWDAMSTMLTQLAFSTIPEEDRPWLCAPPVEWTRDLRAAWGLADPSMRSGTCGLVVRVEKDGKGLAGFHVLVRKAPEPSRERVFRTGFRNDKLSFAPRPFGRHDTFGYGGGDRPKTRYGVSDASGEVRFEKLPEGEAKLEILIPTANFPEAARDWDLCVEVEPGKLERAAMWPAPDKMGPRSPQAIVKLEPGKVLRYPLLVVRPRYDLNVEDYAQVDKDNLVLRWPGFTPPAGAKIRYELEMALTRPGWSPGGVDRMPVIRSAKEVSAATSWPVGGKGVGGLRLAPGNMYLFEVAARDESGAVLARWGKTWVWAPWEHRQSLGPIGSGGDSMEMPIPDDLYFRLSRTRNGEEENFPQWIDRWLGENPRAFECEYLRVIRGWLAWHDGKIPDARKQLGNLIKQLPKGNLVHSTAIWLLGEMDAGNAPPRRLKFVAFEDLDPDRASAVEKKL